MPDPPDPTDAADQIIAYATSELSHDDPCDCDGLPEGVPCFPCYLDGAEFNVPTDEDGDAA